MEVFLKYLTILYASVILFSCGKTHKLYDKDISEQPYRVGDTLVFESNLGGIDSIFIKEIGRFSNPTDPLDVFPVNVETIRVSGEITLRTPFRSSIGKLVSREFIELLELKSGQGRPYFEMGFYKPRDTLKYFKVFVPLDSLREASLSESQSFTSRNYESITPFEHDLLAFFWNRQLGYTGYEFKNGIVWELTSKKRKGRELVF